jgi:methylthioribose-1-phosphate isomerase
MKKTDYFSVRLVNNELVFLDQTLLPYEEKYFTTSSYERIALAIERLEIRGAPLIGIAAAYALALSQKEIFNFSLFEKAYERLKSTRPTAVNLFSALNRVRKIVDNYNVNNSAKGEIFNLLIAEAKAIHNEDEDMCRLIGINGLSLFTKKMNVLTHCNTGKLATGGEGTAFNVIKSAFENDLVNHVYADETRPLFQGSRLTAFELHKNNIPFSVLPDSAAASLFALGKVDIVLAGADRIARNGDSANKIGTYNLALLANYHDIPFYIAAPSTTIDLTTDDASGIPIEQRNRSEVIGIFPENEVTKNIDVYNPSFDITPSKLITGIITEKGIFNFPYSF